MAGRDEAKKVRTDIVAYADDWLKEEPKLDQEFMAIPSIREMFEQGMREAFRQGPEGWLADVFAISNWGFEIEGINTPIEVFHGSSDKIIFPAMSRSIAEQVPQGRFNLIPDEGHCCIYRQWVRILESTS
jgi:pimeloyl-ACP methyl ester carboxylesterase